MISNNIDAYTSTFHSPSSDIMGTAGKRCFFRIDNTSINGADSGTVKQLSPRVPTSKSPIRTESSKPECPVASNYTVSEKGFIRKKQEHTKHHFVNWAIRSTHLG